MRELKKCQFYFFSYIFPPYKAIGAIRLHALASNLQKLGFNINVLASKNALIPPLQKFDNVNINVKYVFTLDYKSFQLFFSRFNLKSDDFDIKKKNKNNPIKKRYNYLPILISFPFNLIIGMGGLFYIINCFCRTIFKLKSEDIIFSSYSPYADHIISYLHKLLNPSLYWICDFRDLHITPGDESKYFFLNLNRWVNYKIISKANLVTTVSDGLSIELKKHNDNVFVLRNGLHEELLERIGELGNDGLTQDYFTITYTGGLYSGRRNPSLLFRCMAELINDKVIDPTFVRLIYAGRDSQIWNQKIHQFCLDVINIDKGSISLDESLKLQQKSTLNLLITWTTPQQKGHLTGKFYEYLMMNKPIINIINGFKDEEFESVFKKMSAGKLVYNDEAGQKLLSDYLSKTFTFWKKNNYVKSSINKDYLKGFHWNELTKDLLDEISITAR